MRNKKKRLWSFLVAASMSIMLVPNVSPRAEGEITEPLEEVQETQEQQLEEGLQLEGAVTNVTAADYFADSEGNMVYVVPTDTTFNDVEIPDGCAFICEGATATIDGTITIKAGGRLELVNNEASTAHLVLTNGASGLVAEQDASIMLMTKDNAITGINFYDEIGENDYFTANPDGFWNEFFYLEMENNPGIFKWCKFAEPPIGSEDIIGYSKQYIYAYSGNLDADGDTDKDLDDIRQMLAEELYFKFIFVDMCGTFGIPRDNDDPTEGINEIRDNRIDTITAGAPIEAKDASGAIVSIPTYVARIIWGENEEGTPIENDVIVYALPSENHILVCTDFNEQEGKGSKYYLRHVFSDRVDFSSNAEDRGLLISDNIGDEYNVVAGGHNGVMDTYGIEPGYMSFGYADFPDSREMAGGAYRRTDYNVNVRVMSPEEDYVVIRSEGETLKTDGFNLNGHSTDTVYKTGDDVTALVYVGDSKVTVAPLEPAIAGTTIEDVTLADPSMADGVKIDKSDLNNIQVKFLSNFYDSVTLNVKYSDGDVKKINIERVGLVINYEYINHENTTGVVGHDCYTPDDAPMGTFVGPTYTYDFAAGEQIIITATYYHPSNDKTASGSTDLSLVVTYGDGTSEIISHKDQAHNFDGYMTGRNGAVATTTFIIGFVSAHDASGASIASQNYKGGLNAIVVNGGYDNKDSFGGVQIGNGKGVEWSGNINWFNTGGVD